MTEDYQNPEDQPEEEDQQEQPEEKDTGPDPHDVDEWAAPPDYDATGGVSHVRNDIEAGPKPPRDQFFQIHEWQEATRRGETHQWCKPVFLYTDETEGSLSKETYIVKYKSEAYRTLYNRIVPALVVAGITLDNDLFLWELKKPRPENGRQVNRWAESRFKVALAATEQWVRIEAQKSFYNHSLPVDNFDDPDWEEFDFEDLFDLAYQDRGIAGNDHPVIRRLQGRK